MQAGCALVDPASCGGHGVLIKDGLALVVALDEAHTAAAADVDRREYLDHRASATLVGMLVGMFVGPLVSTLVRKLR